MPAYQIDDLRQLASEKYRNDDLTEMVVADAEKHGTTQRILDGELVLPHKHDAINHRNRLLGIAGATATETSQQLTIQDLQKRLRLLEDKSVVTPPASAPVVEDAPLE